MLAPLLFEPVYKDYLWGGERIAEKYHRRAPARCAESWELSDHPHGMSVVESGPLAGKTLRELLETHGEALLGTGVNPARFPLLIKLIDAKDRLSVQVHPNEKTAPLTGGEPKTEMWYVLDGSPGMAVYAGLAPGVTPRLFAGNLQSGEMDAVLSRRQVRRGEVVFIPGGLVHAIDRGCLLYEVQQSSDTTYRLWDWGRVDVSGKPRELHVEQAMKTIDWENRSDPFLAPSPARSLGMNQETELIANDFFIMKSYALREPQHFDTTQRRFGIFFTAGGTACFRWGEDALTVGEGRTVLIPASLGSYHVEPVAGGAADVLYVTLPPDRRR